jgi:hypothetical protein
MGRKESVQGFGGRAIWKDLDVDVGGRIILN